MFDRTVTTSPRKFESHKKDILVRWIKMQFQYKEQSFVIYECIEQCHI